jgi:hypothetical protein
MADESTAKIPPYVAFSTFTTFLNSMWLPRGPKSHVPPNNPPMIRSARTVELSSVSDDTHDTERVRERIPSPSIVVTASHSSQATKRYGNRISA